MALILPPGTPLPVVFDPDTIDSLNVNTGNGYSVHSKLSLDPPNAKPVYATSHDTEGSISASEAHYDNREIGFSVRCYGTEDQVEDRLNAIYRKLGKIHREGGTLGITTPAGRTIFFDLVNEGSGTTTFDERWLRLSKTDIELRLQARPFWRGEEYLAVAEEETTAPALVFFVSGVGGDVSALVRLVVRDLQGVDHFAVFIGVQSKHTTTDPQAGLYYLATAMKPLGTSTNTGITIRNTDLSSTYKALLSSRLADTEQPFNHKGSLRVFGRTIRPTSNTGAVDVQMEWGEGDYRRHTLNPPFRYGVGETEGVADWTDFGLVHISPDSDRWQFRILGRSTVAGDEIDFTDFLLFPTGESYVELAGQILAENPETFDIQDQFDQSAGALNGKLLPSGETWVSLGGATDYTIDATNHWAARSAVSDVDINGGRYAIPSTGTFTDTDVQVDISMFTSVGNTNVYQGVLARYIDVNNWLQFILRDGLTGESGGNPTITLGGATLFVRKRVAGVVTTIGQTNTFSRFNNQVTMHLKATADGRWFASIWQAGATPGTPIMQGSDSDLATGAALDDGRAGIYDANTFVATDTRVFDNFVIFGTAPTEASTDAAMFADQTLELRHDGAVRDDETGVTYGRVGSIRGSYLRLLPGDNRVIVAPFRNDPRTMGNGFSDDVQADLYVTPRGLVVPAA